ncbi:hypothetical protein Patl1_22935 [Pistacia atlantica]|uniref:Uncharacterized protein n=1 Tax=Pistacia atlantica TaxID=434234 RepID=A0ACC0ZVB0_9ROSI|nr:hypothetical protein Patl1_22935 [Pistacia atlantica]
MENIIHVDEKWFYMTKQSEKYYLLPTKTSLYAHGLQYQQAPNSIDALIEAVQKSYEEQPAKKKPKKRKSMEQGLEDLLNRLSESNVESSP